MDAEDYTSSASSSSASASASPSPPASPSEHRLPPKRRAGRKKFRETRHPVYRGVRARAGGRRWVCDVGEPGELPSPAVT
ncbi:hypothetical protein ACP4OV_020012 [Aristida adscensionis]